AVGGGAFDPAHLADGQRPGEPVAPEGGEEQQGGEDDLPAHDGLPVRTRIPSPPALSPGESVGAHARSPPAERVVGLGRYARHNPTRRQCFCEAALTTPQPPLALSLPRRANKIPRTFRIHPFFANRS